MLYDIADDITFNSKKNYTLNHLIERIKIYKEEDFNYELSHIKMKIMEDEFYASVKLVSGEEIFRGGDASEEKWSHGFNYK